MKPFGCGYITTKKQPFVPVPYGHLSRFWNRDSAAGTKALEAFVPGGRTGTKCPSC